MEFLTSAHPREAAAELLSEALRAALARGGRARIAVPGGSAMGVFVDAAKHLARERERLWVTWTDERCVPHADPASNRGALHRALGDALPTELPLFLDDETPGQAITRVEQGLTRVFDDALDVTLLGMGDDGHVASLFVGHAEPPGERVAHVADSPKPPPSRITLTRRMLGRSARTILYATGEEKRAALARLLRADPALPASELPGLSVVTNLALESLR